MEHFRRANIVDVLQSCEKKLSSKGVDGSEQCDDRTFLISEKICSLIKQAEDYESYYQIEMEGECLPEEQKDHYY